MSNTLYLILGSILVVGILIGIVLMSKVKSSRGGNLLASICLFAIVLLTIIHSRLIADWRSWAFLAVGALIGAFLASRVKMIQMPQMVALLNGLGGAASALVAIVTLQDTTISAFTLYTSQLALAVGAITLSGSLIAAGKLAKILPQKPVVLKGHSIITAMLLVGTLASMVFSGSIWWITALISLLFGVVFAMRVGGADMPITISLLNSLSGVAGGIAGIALGDPVLIAVGGIVGASGLLLTQIMCRAMNRRLIFILLGKTAAVSPKKAEAPAAPVAKEAEAAPAVEEIITSGPEKLLADAKDVIIVPGYGMALSQAQQHVRRLADAFEQKGARVRYAIHPVAGRMPGHMNVLLCEADVPYEQLFEMDDINADFAACDLAIAIGANDTINPAANIAEGTPIYGMPVLDIGDAKNIFVLNFDDKPGYAGVPNPLYTREDVVFMMGDAKDSINKLLDMLSKPAAETVSAEPEAKTEEAPNSPARLLADAKDVIIVPGYGMALSQAQQQVKSLADTLEQKGARVRYAIHPVAGRMPGHMNVLLCEADVPYEQLFEMDDINADSASCDLAIAIGANDTINPAANTAEGTPIYGMPVLDIGDAK
ncbi:MAG: NAD(P)(+) transhydrogenase (Re/Si-specific) subunit beta, partial [Clostridia bacterium]|nr:NAD(P)(+) transhydrogenase (Re/Si-specific) subunit beta [Clostridia bacterium]